MGHNIEQGAGGLTFVERLLKFKGFVASVPRRLKLIVGGRKYAKLMFKSIAVLLRRIRLLFS